MSSSNLFNQLIRTNKNFIIWIVGFVVLFSINVVVEWMNLPAIGLDNTLRNDIYFQCWWLLVAFGLLFLWVLDRRKS